MNSDANRIDAKFGHLRKDDQAAFIPFLTAGDPDLQTTKKLILAAEKAGADVIELGFPFSDPIADGPTIQASYTRVLEKGQKTDEIFELVKSVREESEIPIVAMVSYSIVYRLGFETFRDRACEAGLDGATIPDLPTEEMAPLKEVADARNFRLICFITPSTTQQRRAKAVALAGGFIYYIAVRGITGEREELADDLLQNIESLRSLTDVPVAVGFGISCPEHARAVGHAADGVIVGSAIIRRIQNACEESADPVDAAAAFISEMAKAAKQL